MLLELNQFSGLFVDVKTIKKHVKVVNSCLLNYAKLMLKLFVMEVAYWWCLAAFINKALLQCVLLVSVH